MLFGNYILILNNLNLIFIIKNLICLNKFLFCKYFLI